MTYQGRRQTATPPTCGPLRLPGAIDVRRVAAGFHDGELFLTILAESGRVSTFAIAGEALDSLRDELSASPIRLKPACICGTGRSVQCASPRHRITVTA